MASIEKSESASNIVSAKKGLVSDSTRTKPEYSESVTEFGEELKQERKKIKRDRKNVEGGAESKSESFKAIKRISAIREELDALGSKYGARRGGTDDPRQDQYREDLDFPAGTGWRDLYEDIDYIHNYIRGVIDVRNGQLEEFQKQANALKAEAEALNKTLLKETNSENPRNTIREVYEAMMNIEGNFGVYKNLRDYLTLYDFPEGTMTEEQEDEVNRQMKYILNMGYNVEKVYERNKDGSEGRTRSDKLEELKELLKKANKALGELNATTPFSPENTKDSKEVDSTNSDQEILLDERRKELISKFPDTAEWKTAIQKLNATSVDLLLKWTTEKTIYKKNGELKPYLDFSDDKTPWYNLDGGNWDGDHFAKVQAKWINDESIQTHARKIEHFKDRAEKIANLTPESFDKRNLELSAGGHSLAFWLERDLINHKGEHEIQKRANPLGYWNSVMNNIHENYPDIVEASLFASPKVYQEYRLKIHEKVMDKIGNKLPVDFMVDIPAFDKFMSSDAAFSLLALPEKFWSGYQLTQEDINNFQKGLELNLFDESGGSIFEAETANRFEVDGTRNLSPYDSTYKSVEHFFRWLKGSLKHRLS